MGLNQKILNHYTFNIEIPLRHVKRIRFILEYKNKITNRLNIKFSKFAKLNNFVYLKHKKNLNGANARNTGINKSRGKYITFLDDDDEFLKDRLEKIIKKLEEGYDFVCTGYSYKKNNVLINEFYPKINGISIPELQFQILCQNSFFGTGSNIVCKTNFVKKIKIRDDSNNLEKDFNKLFTQYSRKEKNSDKLYLKIKQKLYQKGYSLIMIDEIINKKV